MIQHKSMIERVSRLALPFFFVTGLAQGQDLVVSAKAVHTAAGKTLENASVTMADGKITAVAPGAADIQVDAITPGLVDLSVRVDTGAFSVEQSTEAAIDMSVVDALDLFSHRWKRELESGVTTVLATPADANVIGGFAIVLKTGGETTLDSRLVKGDAVLRGSMGSEPSIGNYAPRGQAPVNFYARRPNTRMGVEWILRKSYYDAIGWKKHGLPATDVEAARHQVLLDTLEGKLPLSVQAWATQDVRTAVYLKEEFGIPHMFVDAGAEAWREPELLARSGMGVVLPPHQFRGRTTDGAHFAWNSAALLQEKGVTVALSGHGSRDVGQRLARQAGFAMRGGLSFDDALAAVTINPARMAGVADRVGSIEVGKDADLVLWQGTPFEPTGRIVGVVLNGELVLDTRSSD